MIHAGCGDADQAIVWLEQAHADRSPMSVWLSFPMYRRLHPDPRFTDFFRRMKLPPPVGVDPPR
jgi:hypothetical protein